MSPPGLPIETINRLRAMRLSMTLAAIARETGISPRAVAYWCEGVEPERCACSRRLSHPGWCAVRYADNDALQQRVGSWRGRHRKWTHDADEMLRMRWYAGDDAEVLAWRINHLLGRTDITASAVEARVGQRGFKRTPEYSLNARREARLAHVYGSDEAAKAAVRTKLAEAAAAPPKPPRKRLAIPVEDARALWFDPELTIDEAAAQIGISVSALWHRFGPRGRVRRKPVPVAPPPRWVSIMSNPDPNTALRLRAQQEQSRGRAAVMGEYVETADGAP